MDNVCRDCGRRFLSDLRFCPHCGGDAMPPKTESWHYRAPGMIAHTDPVEEAEIHAYKQNGWTLVCLGILLIPVWLLFLDILMDELRSEGLYWSTILVFILGSALLALIFVGASFAFQARRPGTQVMAALSIVVSINAWHPVAWVVMVGAFFIVLALWAKGGTFRSPSDPTYLPLLTGIAILSVVLAFLMFLNAPMGGMI